MQQTMSAGGRRAAPVQRSAAGRTPKSTAAPPAFCMDDRAEDAADTSAAPTAAASPESRTRHLRTSTPVASGVGRQVSASRRSDADNASGDSTDVGSDWCMEQTFRMSSAGDFERGLPKGVPVIDAAAVSSVSTAVELLSARSIECPRGCCVVFSASGQAYYLVYRRGCRDEAVRILTASQDGNEDVQVGTPTMGTRSSWSGPRDVPLTPCSRSTRLPSSPSTPSRRSLGRSSSQVSIVTVADTTSSKKKREDTAAFQASFGDDPIIKVSSKDWQRLGAKVRDALQDASRAGDDSSSASDGGGRSKRPAPESVEAPEEAERRGRGERQRARSQRRPTEEPLTDIGGAFFRLGGVIGRGAFGVVRKAIEVQGRGAEALERTAAVKFMTTKTEQAFDTATFEAELLKLLSEGLGAAAEEMVPRYFAHDAVRDGPGGMVRLAMSFVHGEVLDRWIYGISDAQHKGVDVGQLVYGRLPGGRQRTVPLHAASNFARVLLAQMAKVLAVLEPIAYHRDISSHNVLVDFGPCNGKDDCGYGTPNFALIDFGLAVRSSSWPREWNSSNLAGDPRYWTPPAWMAFAFGFHYVERHENQGHVRQYLGRMDHYSVGVLGMEMLFALWDAEMQTSEASAPWLQETREAWCSFWEDSVRRFQMFHLQGPLPTREHMTKSVPMDGCAISVDLLAQVRLMLRSAAVEPANAQLASVLCVLADLLDEHGRLSWTQVAELMTDPTASIASFEPPQPCGSMASRAEVLLASPGAAARSVSPSAATGASGNFSRPWTVPCRSAAPGTTLRQAPVDVRTVGRSPTAREARGQSVALRLRSVSPVRQSSVASVILPGTSGSPRVSTQPPCGIRSYIAPSTPSASAAYRRCLASMAGGERSPSNATTTASSSPASPQVAAAAAAAFSMTAAASGGRARVSVVAPQMHRQPVSGPQLLLGQPAAPCLSAAAVSSGSSAVATGHFAARARVVLPFAASVPQPRAGVACRVSASGRGSPSSQGSFRPTMV